MGIQKINDIYVDLQKVSYIGNPDTQVKSHIGVTLHYFLLIVDGHPVEMICDKKEDLLKLRQTIIEQMTAIEGLLPG